MTKKIKDLMHVGVIGAATASTARLGRVRGASRAK
jgi:hypothetical protein